MASPSASQAQQSVRKDRHLYLGGSDAASVMGVSPWRSSYRLWCEKMQIEQPPDLGGLEFVHWGNLLEPIVAKEFAERTGKRVRVSNKLLRHPTLPFLAGHVDRLIYLEPAFLECKTANAYDFRDWGPNGGGAGDIPLHYLMQVTHYMALRPSFKYCYVAVLIGGNEFRAYRIDRDPAREAKLLGAETDFWHKRVLADDPPPIINEADSRHRWKTVVAGSSVAVGSAERAQIVRLKNIADQIKPLEAEEKKLRNAIFPLFADKEFISDGATGEALARLSPYSQTRFDLEAARANKRAAKWIRRFEVTEARKRLKVLV